MPDTTPISYDPTDASTIEASKRQLSQGGRTFDYVKGGTVVRQLCKVFPLGWRFEYDTPEFIPSSVDANGVPSATGTWSVNGSLIIASWAVSRATGITIGVSDLVLRDIGFCAMPNPLMRETAVKGALTDALKRCARLLGDQFGNSLYDGGEVEEDEHPEPLSHASVHYPKRPTIPAAVRNDDDLPANAGEEETCRYCANILTAKESAWCRDHQLKPACYNCQRQAKDSGLAA